MMKIPLYDMIDSKYHMNTYIMESSTTDFTQSVVVKGTVVLKFKP